MWNKIKAAVVGLWRREPVLVTSALPILVSVGLLTSTQATAVEKTLTGGAALVAQLVAAFGARRMVTSPATLAKLTQRAAVGLAGATITVANSAGPVATTVTGATTGASSTT